MISKHLLLLSLWTLIPSTKLRSFRTGMHLTHTLIPLQSPAQCPAPGMCVHWQTFNHWGWGKLICSDCQFPWCKFPSWQIWSNPDDITNNTVGKKCTYSVLGGHKSCFSPSLAVLVNNYGIENGAKPEAILHHGQRRARCMAMQVASIHYHLHYQQNHQVSPNQEFYLIISDFAITKEFQV